MKTFRELMAGQEVEYEGQPTRLTWAKDAAAGVDRGLRAEGLDMAGRIGDGVILQFADPDLIEWCLGFVKKGAQAAGRDYKKIEVMAAAPVWMSDDSSMRASRCAGFPRWCRITWWICSRATSRRSCRRR